MRGLRKKKSRRQPLRQKYMIQKKVKAWRKKQNKIARIMKKRGIVKRNKKALQIPNSWVGKEKLLREEIALRKEEIEEQQQKVTLKKLKRQAAKLAREKTHMVAGTESQGFEEPKTAAEIRDFNKAQRKQHYKNELNKLVDACDVVIVVLDARDPLSCRSKELETRVASLRAVKVDSSKKLIFVLNKIDLIPPEVLSKWMKHLRREYPVIAFKAQTQQKSGFGRSTRLLTTKGVGTEALLGLLKNYRRSFDIKKPISVGLVGYPNVGKSSIVNSLKRYRCVGVTQTPGTTQNLHEVHVDKDIIIVDSPGVIFNESDDHASLLLKNSVRPEDIDLVETVKKMVSRIEPIRLMEVYGIPAFQDSDGFLTQILKLKGSLKTDGTPNFKVAARLVLLDRKVGRVKLYAAPPELEITSENSGATFVQDWGKDLDINSIINVNVEHAISEMETTVNAKTFVAMKASSAEKMDVED